MKKNKQRKKKNIILIVYLVLVVVTRIINYFYKGLKLSSWYLCIVIILLIIEIVKLLWSVKERICAFLKKHKWIVFILAVSLGVPIVVHFIFYKKEVLTESNWLSFYGDYLSFIGAIWLGYVVYRRDAKLREDEVRKKAKILYEYLEMVLLKAQHLENNVRTGIELPTLPHWREYYFEIAPLIDQHEISVRMCLEQVFMVIENINTEIISGHAEHAPHLYENFIKVEQYSISEYNYIEAKSIIYTIAFLKDVEIEKSWKEQCQEEIEEKANKFFGLINTWIFNYMKKNRKEYVEYTDIRYELTDWLLGQPEMKAWVKSPYDKRKIAAVISKASLEMNAKSFLLSYVWGTYSFKN